MKPFLSILIPCRNEARFLGRCLDSILASDYPPERREVLVIDGASTDGTRALIARYQARRESACPVRLIDNPRLTAPCALNLGIEAARGEIIARVDGHTAIPPDYLRRCVESLLSSGADNVGGLMFHVPQDPGCFAGPIVAALTHPFGVGNSYTKVGSTGPRWVDTVFGGCWRREVFERVGRFNLLLRRTQDLEFNLRLRSAGGRILFVPEIWSHYYARSRMGPFWRHNLLNGEWSVLPFLYSSVIPVRLRHLIPLLFVLALLAGALAAPWSGWPLAAVAVPYALLNLAASAHVAAREKRASYLFLMPIVFFPLHLGYGLGSIAGLWKAATASWPNCADFPQGADLRQGKIRPEETTCIPRP